ncbi:hypothetical protein SKAU_G00149760 [Synaphobranchus kaupii]|uniref:Uncharacterized protein n=1 Tax=Synaphobranchus kaupii TaxID=118154 RepID=A0A9Q1FTX2_SYNKA|nr:hypothetical protein SKAU_G00149760 [Synaphobranchus kaupii]
MQRRASLLRRLKHEMKAATAVKHGPPAPRFRPSLAPVISRLTRTAGARPLPRPNTTRASSTPLPGLRHCRSGIAIISALTNNVESLIKSPTRLLLRKRASTCCGRKFDEWPRNLENLTGSKGSNVLTLPENIADVYRSQRRGQSTVISHQKKQWTVTQSQLRPSLHPGVRRVRNNGPVCGSGQNRRAQRAWPLFVRKGLGESTAAKRGRRKRESRPAD